ncbi:MAG TPA: 2-C-methyl-D-erythritol 4-phosphate cytidylyltransferase [Tepidisphaeraceae bacterium]|jgi:2-C-methyl-D-erythritol 4-phosphate cytidylyltransferase|nr:2-C-methyl-D-erythritol 4-phosphate cytidylyltransferase [Tepidisphaeraceae bacterium]
MSSLTVILPAAGKSTRFGSDKLRATLRGTPVIIHTVLSFVRHPSVGSVLVAQGVDGPFASLPDGSFEPVHAKVQVVPGGATRAHSVLSALRLVPPDVEWVAIHDAARPLVSADLIDRVFTAAREHGAAAPALPVHLTIKQATGPLPARVERTVPRQQLWAMQTPQICRRAALLAAFERCPIPLEQVTDDVQLIELAGGTVYLVPGEDRNLKITTAMDLKVAEMLMDE